MSERPPSDPHELRREIGPFASVLITVGAMVGSGIFVTPHYVALLVRSATATWLLWLAGGALTLLGALSFVELGAALPETGGMYVYLRRAFGPVAAFAFAWSMTMVLVPSSVGFFASVAAEHLSVILRVPTRHTTALTVGVIGVLLGVNLGGVRQSAWLQGSVTLAKVVGVLLLAVGGLFVRRQGAPLALPLSSEPGALPWVNTLAALVPVLWSYDGWVDVTSVAGEVRSPGRNVPRSLVVGTVLVAGLYLLANVTYLRVMGPAALAQSATPAADAAALAFGARGRTVVSLLVALSTFGGCAVALLTGSRVIYAVARDGLFLPAFARTSARGVPSVALVASCVLAVLYVSSPVGDLANVFVIGAWPFYALAAVATVRLRSREPALARPYRTPGYPWTPVVFAAVSLGVVASYGITQPWQLGMSVGIIALGGPVYGWYAWQLRRGR